MKKYVSVRCRYLFERKFKNQLGKYLKIAKRDKKAFLSNQCKKIEENNRIGKTKDLFRKIRDTRGTLHAKMGSIKDRNGMDLTEAEDIKKRWQEYTEELYKCTSLFNNSLVENFLDASSFFSL